MSKRSILSKPSLIIIIALILTLLFSIIYYLKSNNILLKSYVNFKIPSCLEPIWVSSESVDSKIELTEWPEYAGDAGYTINVPKNWNEIKDCNEFDKCFKSDDINYGGNPTKRGVWLSNGINLSIRFVDKNYDFGGRYMIDVYGKLIESLKDVNCSYFNINGNKVVDRSEKNRNKRVVFVESNNGVYILEFDYADESSKTNDEINNVISSFKTTIPVEVKNKESVLPYSGVPSPRVPYKKLNFEVIDVYKTKPVQQSFNNQDYTIDGLAVDGFTFVADKGDVINIIGKDGGNTGNGIDIRLELYSYGPTVIRSESFSSFKVPVTGRYFLVVKSTQDSKDKDYSLEFRISE